MQSETPSPPSKPRLRWYQYRLRTLLILMTLLAVWMAWVSHRARQQKAAVEKILELGGKVAYDYQKMKGQSWGMYDYDSSPPGPSWLRKWIGEDYFQTVAQVDLSNTKTNNDDLTFLQYLPNLEVLFLAKTQITSDGLTHLEKLRKLKGLFLDQTRVDDIGLAHLENLSNLQCLVLYDTKITDAGMVHLQNLTTLNDTLNLVDTPITDESLPSLKHFKNLKRLILVGTKFTEEGVKKLKEDLPNTKIMYTQNGQEKFL